MISEYPFDKLNEGGSFVIPTTYITKEGVRRLLSDANEAYGKKYVYVKHEAQGVYEISQVVDVQHYPIYMSSPQMQIHKSQLKKLSEYPFEQLQVGQSFVVSMVGVTESSIRIKCTKAGRRLNASFKCRKDSELQIYEVGRVQ